MEDQGVFENLRKIYAEKLSQHTDMGGDLTASKPSREKGGRKDRGKDSQMSIRRSRAASWEKVVICG